MPHDNSLPKDNSVREVNPTPENISWTVDEKAVFEKLGVAAGDETLKLLIRGQRKINGRIFEALGRVLKCFPRDGLSAECLQALDEAKDIVDRIPGEDPPFCEQHPFN